MKNVPHGLPQILAPKVCNIFVVRFFFTDANARSF